MLSVGDRVYVPGSGATGTVRAVEWIHGQEGDLWAERQLHVVLDGEDFEVALAERMVAPIGSAPEPHDGALE